jgi:hypothetical protein
VPNDDDDDDDDDDVTCEEFVVQYGHPVFHYLSLCVFTCCRDNKGIQTAWPKELCTIPEHAMFAVDSCQPMT